MKIIKKVFLGVVIIAIILFTYSGFNGAKQISQREKDYTLYLEAKNDIQSGENLENSIKILDELAKNYNESYIIDIDKAIGYINLKKYKSSLDLFEQALNKNKSLNDNAGFLIMYAEAYDLSGNKEKAIEYILKAQTIGIPKEYQNIVANLMK